jgi:hypothetical protein
MGWAYGVPGPLLIAPTLVYFADTGWALLKRVYAGKPLNQAHRGHVYQRLVGQGWSHLASAGWSAGLAAVTCLVAATMYDRQPMTTFVLAILVALAYLATPRVKVRSMAEKTSVS